MDKTIDDVMAEVLAEMDRPRLVTKIHGGYLIDAHGWQYDLPEVNAAQALSWLYHLRDKTWFSRSHEDDLLAAFATAGVFKVGLGA